MDLQPLFPDKSVCLISSTPKAKTWRLLGVSYTALNYLRRWLMSELLTVAIHQVEFFENTTVFHDEIIAQRLGLLPIVADPLLMYDFIGEDPHLCDEDTCLIFDLDVDGNYQQDVKSGDLIWRPVGDQINRFKDPPRVLYPNLLLAKIFPGQHLSLTGYAIRGAAEDHAKWSGTFVHYRMVPTRRPAIPGSLASLRTSARAAVAVGTAETPSYPGTEECQPCEVLVNIQPGVDCYYFTIELISGITFEQIQEQLETNFQWSFTKPVRKFPYVRG